MTTSAKNRSKIARQNGRHKRGSHFLVTTASTSALLRTGRLNKASLLGKAENRRMLELRDQYGAMEMTPALESVIRSAVRSELIEHIAWADISDRGVILGKADKSTLHPAQRRKAAGLINPAVEVFLRAARVKREVFTMLGLERKAKRVPTLAELLSQPPKPQGDVLPPDPNDDADHK